jgi:hypothetical protein
MAGPKTSSWSVAKKELVDAGKGGSRIAELAQQQRYRNEAAHTQRELRKTLDAKCSQGIG